MLSKVSNGSRHTTDTTIPEDHHSSIGPTPKAMKIRGSTNTLRRCTNHGGNRIFTQDLRDTTAKVPINRSTAHHLLLLEETIMPPHPKTNKNSTPYARTVRNIASTARATGTALTGTTY
ncbi:hypothetical protein E4U50_000369 [Claviceps purpurea]|nr:hypothetical protein E4U50_000369 [Claviceps purpurea]